MAILGDDADPRQAAALADLDEQAAFEAVDALARVDVLRPQPPLAFVHPLIRAAVYETLTPLERDRGHARAARLLANAGAEPERVAAHLLRCPRRGCAGRRDAARAAARRAGSAVLRRAPSPTFAARSRSRRRTRSAPKCSSSSARPRRT